MFIEEFVIAEDQNSLLNKKAAALYKEQQERGERSKILRKVLTEVTKEDDKEDQLYGVFDNGLLYLSYPLK